MSLVLSRCAYNKEKNTLKIINQNGSLITIVISKIKGGQVKLQIDAPDDIMIYREEVFNKILKGDNPGILNGKE